MKMVSMFLFCALSSAAWGQLVVNAGFEGGDGTGWTIIGSGPDFDLYAPDVSSAYDNSHIPGGNYVCGYQSDDMAGETGVIQYLSGVEAGTVRIQVEVGWAGGGGSLSAEHQLRWNDGNDVANITTTNMWTRGNLVDSSTSQGYWYNLGGSSVVSVSGPITIWTASRGNFSAWACGCNYGVDGFWVEELVDVQGWVLY